MSQQLCASTHGHLDVNECDEGTDDCDDETEDCVNTIGSFKCVCKEGYKWWSRGNKCCKFVSVSHKDVSLIKHACASFSLFCSSKC